MTQPARRAAVQSARAAARGCGPFLGRMGAGGLPDQPRNQGRRICRRRRGAGGSPPAGLPPWHLLIEDSTSRCNVAGISSATKTSLIRPITQIGPRRRSPLSSCCEPGLRCPSWQVTGMSMSGQITVGWAGRHVRYSESHVRLGGHVQPRAHQAVPGWAAGHDEPVSCHLRRRRRVPEGTRYRE
jgi:hypothetical protein